MILLSHGPSPTLLSFVVPEKNADGTLTLPKPISLTNDGIAFIPHSGEANQALTIGDRVFIAYGRLTILDGRALKDGAPAFVVDSYWAA